MIGLHLNQPLGRRAVTSKHAGHPAPWCALLHALAAAACILALTALCSSAARAGDAVEVGAAPAGNATEVVPQGNLLAQAPAPQDVPKFDPALLPPITIDENWTPFKLDLSKILLPTDNQALIGYLSEGYTPQAAELSIEDAVKLALEHNHGLNQARMDAMSSCEGIKVQWTAFKPQLSLNAQTGFITTNKGSSSDQGGNQGTSRTPSLSFDGFTTDGPAYSLALALTQRIYDFGLTNHLIDVSRAQYAIKTNTVDITEQQLVNAVIAGYYDFSSALGQVRIRRDEYLLAEEFLRQTRIQFEVGTVPRLDVIRAEARLERARDSVISALSQLGDSSANFYSLLGLEDQRYVPMVLTADLIEAGSEPPALDDVVKNALANRPEIELQYNTLFAGQANIDLTKNRPILQAAVNSQFQHPATTGGDANYQYGLQLLWNVYTGGKDKASRRQAELQLQSLTEGLFNLEAKVELDATISWDRLTAARSSVSVAKKNLDLAAEALRTAAVGYGAGVTPYLDFQTALDSDVSAALAYLFALVEVKKAQANLERAQGYPAGYPGDTRAERDGSRTVHGVLGLPEQEAAGATPVAPAAP